MPRGVQVFNLGSDGVVTLKDLARRLSDTWSRHAGGGGESGGGGSGGGGGGRASIRHVDARAEVKHAEASHEKAACVFGLALASTSLDAGLRETVASVAATGAIERMRGPPREFDEVEVIRGLPPSWRHERMREVAQVELGPLHNAPAPAASWSSRWWRRR